ncbi:MAG: DEAD/DEAH box helicase [Gammaproteobacteria bacterium]
MTSNIPPMTNFSDLALAPALLKILQEIGYEVPTPIQAQIIPFVLAGRDVIGQAQTGTGKTAAFALPLLSRLDPSLHSPQVLVLTPTRELTLQVAEAFQKYATYLPKLQVAPIYGGQDYVTQLKRLKRGVQVIVGTPGRVMDHMRRETLKLDNLKCLVLDEADEMLRMGFIDDVEWVLAQTPGDRQIALFSATMPDPIRRIAKKYLKNPEQITLKVKTTTAETIHQRYCMTSPSQKLDILTRVLEAETFEGIIIFVRTKTETQQLAEELSARGYACAPLNGDIAQVQRTRTVEQLKQGKIDIVIATDVAARGLDVKRISHVINYDMPYDTESYVHRIGRTGRAGRTGEAILFVAPREQRMLEAIEKATRQKITAMQLPSTEIINTKRIAKFTQRITETLANKPANFSLFRKILDEYQRAEDISLLEIATALASQLQGDVPLLMRQLENAPNVFSSGAQHKKSKTSSSKLIPFRIEVGRQDGVKPGNIVGAIAHEMGLNSQHIGRIKIHDDHSVIELPAEMEEHLKTLRKIRVAQKPLNISKLEAAQRDKRDKRDKGKRSFNKPQEKAAPRKRPQRRSEKS